MRNIHIKTITRIENNKSVGQYEVIIKLLNRLKIASVMQKSNIVLSNFEQYQKELKMHEYLRKNNFDSAMCILHDIINSLDFNNIYDLQYATTRETSINHRKKEITDHQYYLELTKALEYTLDIKNISFDTFFMTMNEKNCIYNIALLPLDTEEKTIVIQYISRIEESETFNEYDIKTKEMLLIICGNYYFDICEYKKSFEYFKKLLSLEIIKSRTYLIYYSMMRMKKCTEKEKIETLLDSDDLQTLILDYYKYY